MGDYVPIDLNAIPSQEQTAVKSVEVLRKEKLSKEWSKYRTVREDALDNLDLDQDSSSKKNKRSLEGLDEDIFLDQSHEFKSSSSQSQKGVMMSCVHFAQRGSHNHLSDYSELKPKLACTAGTRILIYDAKNMKLLKTISRAKGTMYSAQIRYDNSLLACGTETGEIQVYNLDVPGSSMLRSFSHKSSAVQAVRWSSVAGNKIFSCSDDKTARLWDLSVTASSDADTSSVVEPINTFTGHTDYVRSACSLTLSSSSEQWATGCYDHVVRIFDPRSGSRAISSFQHNAPIEAVLALPGSSILLSASGDTIYAWDMVKGSNSSSSSSNNDSQPQQSLLHSMTNHSKTVTSLCLDFEGKFFFSGSLDAHVHIHDLHDFSSIHRFKVNSPVLSLSIGQNNTRYAIGTASEGVIVKEKKSIPPPLLPLPRPFGGTRRYFVRGRDEVAGEDDLQAQIKRVKKLKAHDKLLKEFRFSEALDEALSTRKVSLVMSMLEELMNRGALYNALRSRDEISFEPILAYIIKYLPDPRYTKFLCYVAKIVIDIYIREFTSSPVIDPLMVKLSKVIKNEVELHTQIHSVVGVLDMLIVKP